MREPFAEGTQGGCGDQRWPVGDGVVRKAVRGIADDDLLVKENTEPFGSVFVGVWKRESAGGDLPGVAGDGKGDRANIGRIGGADEADRGSALAVDPFAVNGVKGPGAVEGKTPGGTDDTFVEIDGIE